MQAVSTHTDMVDFGPKPPPGRRVAPKPIRKIKKLQNKILRDSRSMRFENIQVASVTLIHAGWDKWSRNLPTIFFYRFFEQVHPLRRHDNVVAKALSFNLDDCGLLLFGARYYPVTPNRQNKKRPEGQITSLMAWRS